MNTHFHEALEKKLYWAERRLRIAQKDLWMYKTMIAELGIKPKKKIEQLEMFTGS